MSNVVPIHGHARVCKLDVGQLFVGRYRLCERLGRGGMGEVWTAEDEKIRRVVALKLLHPKLLEEPGSRARFERESFALTQLEHPRVVPLYDWGTEPQPFIVMKRIVGTTLRQMLREQHQLPWVVVVCFALQIAEGLSAMHRAKLWHRDIKPENLMVDEEGNVSILDLGIACDAGAGRGGTTDRLGTRGYLPPETILGRATDHRRDLYALGVTLYELLTGDQPFGDVDEANDTDVQAAHVHDLPDPIRARTPECPEALEALVLRLLAKAPDQRYQSARSLAADLGQVLRHHGSMPPGEDMELLVLRSLGRRKLNSLVADTGAQAPPEVRRGGPGRTEPMEARRRETLPLGLDFVAPSPASPSSRPMAARTPAGEDLSPEPSAEPTFAEPDVPWTPRTCGFYPAAVMPAPEVTVEPAQPARTMELPRAAVPEVWEPFPIAKPKGRSAAKASAPQMAWLAGVTALAVVLAVVAAVVTVWAMDARRGRGPEAPATPTIERRQLPERVK